MTTALVAKELYVREFEKFARNGARKAPAWLRNLRSRAMEHFAEVGFPSTHDEAWRFTSLAPLLEQPFALVHGSKKPSTQELAPLWIGGETSRATRLVVVNGTFAPELSTAGTGLHAQLESNPEFAERHLTRYAAFTRSPFAALNTAFFTDGAVVHVAAGQRLEQPIEVLFVSTPIGGGSDPAPVSYARNLIVLDAGARATVIETHASIGEGPYWTNSVTEIAVADGADLEYVRVQRDNRAAFHIASTESVQARDAMLRFHPFALGAGLARHDIRTVLDGAGTELVLNGFYLLRGAQHADHHTVIEHAQPHGTSHEYFNGIVGERAHGVFTGRIIVRPGAQRTDSKQTNNNLLLSPEARADSQPQLEIYADDVKCTHGSTVGPLDEAALYYLRSRGLSAQTAAAMLTYGLAAEILGHIRDEDCRNGLERVVRGRLAERTSGGRRRDAA